MALEDILTSSLSSASNLGSEHFYIVLIALPLLSILCAGLAVVLWQTKILQNAIHSVAAFWGFFYSSFLKPHSEDEAVGQQAALESFYKVQADVYDATRKRLLCGREDMLGLVAAQMKFRAEEGAFLHSKPVWVDIGGGTGYNIEAMQAYLDVPTFFSGVYLVDLSPSLCAVARKRFERLGWDVKVLCQDARSFRLGDHPNNPLGERVITKPALGYPSTDADHRSKADVITMSYSLSMIPDYYNVVDSLTGLLAPQGIIGVVDFYVQSIVETAGRNYIGGSFNRHVNWLSRVIWRSWFDCDRVGLEGARRVSFQDPSAQEPQALTLHGQDYLEYRFGTKKAVDERNYLLGAIPYYIFLGCQRELPFSTTDLLERVDASCTESPYLSPRKHRAEALSLAAECPAELRSKAYQSAIVNLNANLPLPSTFYQNHQRRIHYSDKLKKHKQFNNDYLYAFTWEDPRVDQRLLDIRDDDVVLALTSAGDNLLEYLVSASPKRIHAVDLNPNQNHLLELKIAAFQTLSYPEVWKLFGEGRYPAFREALINKLSPHMSSQAFQFWLNRTGRFTSSRGLYESGGSGHAIKMVRWLSWVTGISSQLRRLSECKTLNEQRETWPGIRQILLSRPLHWAVIGTEWWVWKAAGVPPAQRQMILADHLENPSLDTSGRTLVDVNGEAMWEYIVNTLDPVARDSLISDDNYHYLLTVKGSYSRRCYPGYLGAKAHAKLSRPNAFAGLRIHTDEINEVIARISPATLTIAVIMDSMDWFSTSSDEAAIQIKALNHALKLGGRVLLRSAGLNPWVNMYASTWIMTKTEELASPRRKLFGDRMELEILEI